MSKKLVKRKPLEYVMRDDTVQQAAAVRLKDKRVFWACAVVVMLLVVYWCMIPALTESKMPGGFIDFGGFVKDVTIHKETWPGSGEVVEVTPENALNPNDTVQINIDYNLPMGTLSAESNTITYTVDSENLTVLEEQDGIVRDSGGADVGTYHISTDGTITIVFNDDYVQKNQNSAVSGTVAYEGTITKSKDVSETENVEIKFGDVSVSVTIQGTEVDNNPNDITVNKTHTAYDPATGIITYQVEIGTNKGSGSTISLTDTLNSAGMTFVDGSVTAELIGTDGTTTTLSPSVVIDGSTMNVDFVFGTTQTEDTSTEVATESGETESGETTAESGGDETEAAATTIEKLNQGEKIVVTYQVQVDPSASATENVTYQNQIEAETPDANPKQDMDYTTIYSPVYDGYKDGWIDTNNKIAYWTVEFNRNGQDISGYTFTELTAEMIAAINSNIVISAYEYGTGTHKGDVTIDKSALPYTFPEGSNYVYKITYSTSVKSESFGNVTVTNTATLDDPDTAETPDYSYTKEFTFNNHVVSKNSGNSFTYINESGETVETLKGLEWTSHLKGLYGDTIPAGAIFKDVFMPEGSDTYGKLSSRVALMKQLAMSDTTLVAGTDYKITLYGSVDSEGNLSNDVTNAAGDTLVAGFTIEFLRDITDVTDLSLTYSTVLDTTGMVDNDTRMYQNTAQYIVGDNQDSTTADYTYTKKKMLEKWDSPENTADDTTHSMEDLPETEAGQKYLEWTLIIRSESNWTDDITLVDTLPAGLTFLDVTEVGVYKNNYFQSYSSWTSEVNTANNVSYTVSGQNLTFTVPAAIYNQEPDSIYIRYRAALNEDALGTSLEKAFENTVSMTYGAEPNPMVSTTQTQTVKESLLDKNYVAGTAADKMKFEVLINETAQDLSSTDRLSFKDTLSYYRWSTRPTNFDLVKSSIILEAWDETTQTWSALSASLGEFSYQYIEEEGADYTYHYLLMDIPDGKKLRLTYEYFVTGTSEVTFTNEAELVGTFPEGESSDKETTRLQLTSSSATANVSEGVTFEKVDANNFAVMVPGATFEIQEWNGTEWVVKEPVTGQIATPGNPDVLQDYTQYYDAEHLVSGQDGTFNVRFLDVNQAYRLVEVSAPGDYLKANICYFYIKSGVTTGDNEPNFPTGNTLPTSGYVVIGEDDNITIQEPRSSQVTFTKVDYVTHEALAGAVFEAYEWNDATGWTRLDGTFTADANGQVTITDICYNRAYKLVEITAPSGYLLREEPIYFYLESENTLVYPMDLPDDAQTEDLFVTNYGAIVYKENATATEAATYIIPNVDAAEVAFQKVAAENLSLGLPGATFDLYQWIYHVNYDQWGNLTTPTKEWVKVGTYTSAELGNFTVAGLLYNMPYKLVETTAPEAYVTGAEMYFYVESEHTNLYPWYASEGMPDGWFAEDGTTVAYNKVDAVPKTGEATVYPITNEKRKLSVEKIWRDDLGVQIADTLLADMPEVTVTLYATATPTVVDLTKHKVYLVWQSEYNDTALTKLLGLQKDENGYYFEMSSTDRLLLDVELDSAQWESWGKDRNASVTLKLTDGEETDVRWLSRNYDGNTGNHSLIEIYNVTGDVVLETSGIENGVEGFTTMALINSAQMMATENSYTDYMTGATVVKENVKLNASNGWTVSWDDLPQTDDAGNTLYYFAVEEVVDNYDVIYSALIPLEYGEDGLVLQVINTSEYREKVNLSIRKEWKDTAGNVLAESDVPDTITLRLYRYVDDIADKVLVEERTFERPSGGWTTVLTWTDLLKYVDDNDLTKGTYTYVIEEVLEEGSPYTPTITVQSDGTYYITNMKVSTIDVDVNKSWLDEDGNAITDTDLLPEYIEVQLYQDMGYQNGVLVLEPIGDPVKVTKENNWQYIWQDLPRHYLNSNNQWEEVNYTVRELSVPEGFVQSGDVAKATDYTNGNQTLTVTNKALDRVDITVEKNWLDEDGNAITDNTNLPAYVEVQLYQTYTDENWATVTVAYGDPIQVQADENWTLVFTDLPAVVLLSNGTYASITYTAEELTDVAGFTLNGVSTETNTTDKTQTIQITNQAEDTRQVSVTKVWKDIAGNVIDGSTDTLPEQIVVQLYQSYRNENYETVTVAYGDPVTITGAEDWSYIWSMLPLQYDITYTWGSETVNYEYTVQEVTVPAGYKASTEVTTDSKGDYLVTLTNQQIETIEVTVNKTWQDGSGNTITDTTQLPEEILLQLYRSYTANWTTTKEAVGEAVTLNAAGNWSYTWTDLAKNYSDDVAYTYTVEEVSGITSAFTLSSSSSTADEDGNIIVSLVNVPKTDSISLEVNKTWQDATGATTTPPTGTTITYTLYAVPYYAYEEKASTYEAALALITAGTATKVEEVTVGAADEWSYTWATLTPTTLDAWNNVQNWYFFVTETVNAPTGTTSTMVSYTVTHGADGSTAADNSNGGAYMVGSMDGTIAITNQIEVEEVETLEITISKVWKDASGATITWPEGMTIELALYQITTGTIPDTDPTPYKTVTVSASDLTEGLYTFTGLPVADAEGNAYYYYVKELAVKDSTGADCTDSYSITQPTEVVQSTSESKTMTLTNQTAAGYELPSTGGTGTLRYYIGGLILMLGAALWYICNGFAEKKRRKTY